MRLKNLKAVFHKELDSVHESTEVDNFFFMLTEAFYGIPRLQLALQPELTITKEEQEPIFKALDALKKNKPIQYILGEAMFYSMPFKVTDAVLIPRPETEELVSWIIDDVTKLKAVRGGGIRILDIGAGSGCIAIALAKNLPEARVYALDVSKEALDIARHNAAANDVKITFLEKNILDRDLVLENLDFDIIVSNPPYVRVKEKEQMRANVLNYEPHLALFVENDDALQFYRVIMAFAKIHLKEKGALYFEINEYLGAETSQLMDASGYEAVTLQKDLSGKDRMLKGILQ